MRIIGLDIGKKRIGVARADSSTRIAVPVGYIDVDGSEWQEIARIVKISGSRFFVLGLPRSNEGNETEQSLYVRRFAQALVEKIPGVRVRLQDESLTSVVAEERLKASKKKYSKGDIDAEAAAIILQDFLESLAREKQAATGGEIAANNAAATGVVSGVRNAVSEAGETVSNLTKKEADKVKLRTKKAKHKMGGVAKTMIILVVAILIAGAATGGIAWFLNKKEQEREEYARWLQAVEEGNVFEFTILPGETIFEIKNKLIEVGYAATEVEEAFQASYDFDFLKKRPEGATLEGYLFGETHEFYKDASVKEILETFLKGMGEVISQNNLEAKYAEHGLSLYEGITLASIVQKEAGALTSDMPTVAQVFLSRLNSGMHLGSDVTVSYALEVADPDRQAHTDNSDALTVDSCYNTRLYRGLPCGPISNPGLAALLAVATPSDTSYLYFLTGDDGLMYYSYTEDEHIQNIYSHCQNLCSVAL